MRKLGVNVSRWKCDAVAHPLQEDTTSCGVFALKVGRGYVTWQKLHIDMLSITYWGTCELWAQSHTFSLLNTSWKGQAHYNSQHQT